MIVRFVFLSVFIYFKDGIYPEISSSSRTDMTKLGKENINIKNRSRTKDVY